MPSRTPTVVVSIAVALAAIAFEWVPKFASSCASVLLWSAVSVALCAVALRFAQRLPLPAIPAELGLMGSPWPATAVIAIASTAPMTVLLLAHGVPVFPAGSILLPVAILGPVGEEVVFRGYLFQQLHRRAGWGFWPAVGLSSVLFGLAHFHGAKTLAAPMEVIIPAIGGAFFAWLLLRWRGNLWVPIAVHAALNFWWEVLHSTGDPAAGKEAELARAVFIALVIVKTLRETPAFETETATTPTT